MMIKNEFIKEGIQHDLINAKLTVLIYMSCFKDDGSTATMISKTFNYSFPYISHMLKRLEIKGYIVEIPFVNKREKRRVLTEKAYKLFETIGVLKNE